MGDNTTTNMEDKTWWYARQKRPRFCPVRPYRHNATEDQRSEEDGCLWSFRATDLNEALLWKEESSRTAANDTDPAAAMQVWNTFRATLRREGFAIVSQLLSPDECHEALQLAVDWWEAAHAAERMIAMEQEQQQQEQEQQQEASATTTTTTTSPLSNHNNTDDSNSNAYSEIRLQALEGGIYAQYGAGHSTLAWYVRRQPVLYRILQHLWASQAKEQKPYDDDDEEEEHKKDTYDDDIANETEAPLRRQQQDAHTDDSDSVPVPPPLVTSLDGLVLWTEAQQPNDVGWFHIDQNPQSQPSFAHWQGLVTLTATTPETGGNVVVRQSHHYFPQHYTCHTHDNNSGSFYRQRLSELAADDDWLEIHPEDDTILNEPDIVCAGLAAGDWLLWDSRVVHCSVPPGHCTTTTRHHEQHSDGGETPPPNDNNNDNDDNNKNNMKSAANKQLDRTKEERHSSSSTTTSTTTCPFVRAAVLVTMRPVRGIAEDVLRQRQSSCQLATAGFPTQTHWAHKALVLGHEQQQEQQDPNCQQQQRQRRRVLESMRGVLLSYDELTADQQRLVVGPQLWQQQQQQQQQEQEKQQQQQQEPKGMGSSSSKPPPDAE